MFWEGTGAPGAVLRPTRNALCSPRRAFLLLAALSLLLVVAAGCGRSQSAVTETKDDYQVTFATEPASPNQGAGVIIVTIKDQQGRGVAASQVSIEANMAHAGMTPERATSANGADGEYRLPLNWSMGGAWYVDVKITLPNGDVVKRQFPVDVK